MRENPKLPDEGLNIKDPRRKVPRFQKRRGSEQTAFDLKGPEVSLRFYFGFRRQDRPGLMVEVVAVVSALLSTVLERNMKKAGL